MLCCFTINLTHIYKTIYNLLVKKFNRLSLGAQLPN